MPGPRGAIFYDREDGYRCEHLQPLDGFSIQNRMRSMVRPLPALQRMPAQ